VKFVCETQIDTTFCVCSELVDKKEAITGIVGWFSRLLMVRPREKVRS